MQFGQITRRRFVKASAVGAVAGQTSLSYGNILGSNEPLRIGLIGFRGRGKALIKASKAADNAKVVALYDVVKSPLTAKTKMINRCFALTIFANCRNEKTFM